ncbi:RNA-directed DNA polymerase, eukaryota, reverse transcriptase zinc-binding domain protein [Tanacetum coccineum]
MSSEGFDDLVLDIWDVGFMKDCLDRPGGLPLASWAPEVYKKLGGRWGSSVFTDMVSDGPMSHGKDAEGPSLDDSLENEEHLDVDSCDSDSPKNVNNDSCPRLDCMEKNLEDDSCEILEFILEAHWIRSSKKLPAGYRGSLLKTKRMMDITEHGIHSSKLSDLVSVITMARYNMDGVLVDRIITKILKSQERFLLDHHLILLREASFDYGPTPFQFFHFWFDVDGFDKFVTIIERCSGDVHMLCVMDRTEIVNNRFEILGKLQQVNKGPRFGRLAQMANLSSNVDFEASMCVFAVGGDGKIFGDILTEEFSQISYLKSVCKRQILDGPFILNEIMQWCRRRKKQSLIFKVDFEKAYDSVRWDFLDDILVKFGFGIKWRGWIQNCLNSSKGSILVNGSPTEEFQFYKGLKQGDPLSPFLFILVMESLHISFQRVVDVGMFTGIKLSSSLNISHLFYADDAIFLGQWNDSNIDTLVHVMECFYRVSGLRINLCKSKIMGIHVDADRIKSAASKLGCLVLNTPFLYLGTKVGENMSRVHAWKEVIVKIKSRLSNWKLKTLSIGGRFTLLKSVLGSTPIFHMSIYKVPSSVLHLLESIRSHFFHGHDPRSKKASWVNWNKVLTAKERGGLGVSSLYALNRGLMCKWVWRFFAHKSLLWSRVIKAIHGPEGGLITDVRRGFRSTWTFIVQEVKKLHNQCVNIFDYTRIKIGNGDNTSFWKDKWHNEGVLKDVFPRLYALERHQNVTIHTKLIDYSLVNSFRRNPRSGVEEFQLDNLSRLVSTITLSSAVDRYVWSLENSGEFSVKSIRQVIDANCFPVIHSATRWVKSVPLKVNIMAWKIKMDGLPTRMNISRRGIEIDSIVCPICNSGAESSCHIFFQCNLVRQLARKISSWWNVDYVDVSSYEEWYTWLVSLRLQANLKAVFEGIFYCLWWSVWMFRNKILFEKDTPSQARIFDNIVSNSYYWCFMDPSHSSALSSVSQNSHVVSLNALTEEIVAYEKEIDDTHAVKNLDALCTPESFVTHSNFDTPGGTVYYIPKVSAAVLLVKGNVYDSVDDCVVAYMKYAAQGL